MKEFEAYCAVEIPKRENFTISAEVESVVSQNLIESDGKEKFQQFVEAYYGGRVEEAEHLVSMAEKRGYVLLESAEPAIKSARETVFKHPRLLEIFSPDSQAVPWDMPSRIVFFSVVVFTLTLMTVGVNALATQFINSGTEFILHPILAYVASLIVPGMSIVLEFASRKIKLLKWIVLAGGLITGMAWIVLATKGVGVESVEAFLAGMEDDAFYTEWKTRTQIVAEMLLCSFLWGEIVKFYVSRQVKPRLIDNPHYELHREYLDRLLLCQQKVEHKIAEWRSYLAYCQKNYEAITQQCLSLFNHEKERRDAEIKLAQNIVEKRANNDGENGASPMLVKNNA